MDLKDAKEEIPTFNAFVKECCNNCTACEWYCPSLCEELEKAKKINFQKIQDAYARHDGDLRKVINYIRDHRVRRY